jgi:hypothetical protein
VGSAMPSAIGPSTRIQPKKTTAETNTYFMAP